MPTTDKSKFIQLLMKNNVLRFGDFTLKSGRLSPYFFDMGAIATGPGLSALGEAYANTIAKLSTPVSCLFGPAYKGIPLVAATSIAFHYKHNRDLPYCFNRKEAKTHGEAGVLVGAPLTNQTVMVDDVITAGTTVTETANLFAKHDAALSAIVIALDRQEQNAAGEHALTAISERFHVPIIPIVTVSDIIDYLQTLSGYEQQLDQIIDYQKRYGTACS